MRKLFRRHRKKPIVEPQPPATSVSALATFQQDDTPRTHVCTNICTDIACIPPECHEQIIAQFTAGLGETPDRIEISNSQISNPKFVAIRDTMSEVDERRAVEGNTDFCRIPLALKSTYQYLPLPKGYARFLRLLGSGSHPSGYLESYPLANPPPYIAISYCWDPNSAKRSMFIDMTSFGISETVLEVVNQVVASQRATGTGYLLWLDQICINQGDQDEKRDQIFRMGEIYSKAEEVFIWLGPTGNNSDMALENMEKMVHDVIAINNATIARVDLPANTATVINAAYGRLYGHLLARQWFRRLWTIQEAVLARKLVIMCGYRSVDFELLVKLANLLLVHGSLDLIQPRGVSTEDLRAAMLGIVNLQTLRRRNSTTDETLKGLGMSKFRILVMESRARNVTMPADRVWALMGVAPMQIREHMASVSKELLPWQLYVRFAKCMLENDPVWLFLSSAPSKERPAQLPSWVPNLNSQQPFASDFAHASFGFSAGTSPGTQHLVNRSITTEELQARGFRLGIVVEIIPQTAFTEDNRNMTLTDIYSDTTNEWDEQCVQLCQKAYGLPFDMVPEAHVIILLAQSTAKPAMDGRAQEAYQIFGTICRMRVEIKRAYSRREGSNPEQFRSVPDEAAALVEHAVKIYGQRFSDEQHVLLLSFAQTMAYKCSGRPYIRTQNGRLGLGCPGIKIDDVVCILYGTTVPFVLRPRNDGTMEYVGDSYIYNAMNGEALEEAGKGPDENFRIR